MSVKNRQPRQSGQGPRTRWILAAFAVGLFGLAAVGVVASKAIANSDNSDPSLADRGFEKAAQGLGETDGDDAKGVDSTGVDDATLTIALSEDYSFKISGFVADEAIRQQLEQATTLIYGELGQVDVAVDADREGLTSAARLAPLPQNLNRLIAGSFSITGNTVTIEGIAPNQANKDALTKLIQGLGFTVDDQTTVANLGAPDIRFIRAGDQVSIVGGVNNDQVGAMISQLVTKDFGAENVNIERLSVDPTVYTRFEVITVAATLKLYQAFGDFDIGFQDNRFGGVFPQGIGFSTGSAELGPEQQAKLAAFPPLLINLTDVSLTITGHADTIGAEDANVRLSEQRAQAIIQLFEGSGIDGSRLTAVGKGSSEPIASNDTSEGRALNRRVTFQLSE